MILKLYDQKKIKFDKKMTLDEVEEIFEEDIFSKIEYQKYYGFTDNKGNGFEEIRNDVNYTTERWLGVKPVGKDKVENVKKTLDIMAYIFLTHNEFDVKSKVSEYKRIRNKKKPSENEVLMLEQLEKDVKYNQNGMFFFVNNKEEQRIKKYNEDKYWNLQSLKTEIHWTSVHIDELYKTISENMSNLKTSEKEHRLYLIKHSSELQDEIYALKSTIADLIDRYKYETEMQIAVIK